MGGGNEPPYIYTPQRIVHPYSQFNPRSATQEIERKARDIARAKAKQDGPLINFNQHPDSYEFGLQRKSTGKPMPKRTKTEVTVVRWVQFALRILEEIGALGLLTCMICLRNMESSVSWIVRISMGWDVVVTLYAIYHLIRPAKARTPASSASYHFFALFMDVCLIPFCVFIAFFSRENWLKEPGKHSRWTTVFKNEETTSLILQITYLAGAVMAGLHLLSAVLDIWLVVLFRKITNLPPDMNPLEENLTSRKANKHKYKNSEITLASSMTERKPEYLSGSTLSVDERSRVSTATKDEDAVRKVPFSHSRAGSEATFSPHNPETARLSRQHYGEAGMYSQPQSARTSRAEVHSYSRPTSMTPTKDGTWIEISPIPPMPSISPERLNAARPTSYPTSRSGPAISTPARYSSPALPNAAPSTALVRSQQKQGLLNDNWFAVDDDAANVATAAPPAIRLERHDSFEHQPLKMNPPTPPPPKRIEYPDPGNELPQDTIPKRKALTERPDNGNGDLTRHLTVMSTATNSSSVYSESAPSLKSSKGNSPPKSRYYGDLSAATRGVRGVKSIDTFKSNGTMNAAAYDSTGFGALGSYGYGAPEPMPKKAPAKTSVANSPSGRVVSATGTVSAANMDGTGFGALGSYGYVAPDPILKKSPARKPVNNSSGRVVSRTGVDIVDYATMYTSETNGSGVRGRRDVSGKVAEEGRGGNAWTGWRRY